MGTAVRPAKTFPGSWDAFADVDVFVDEVLAELEAMARDGARPIRSGQNRRWPERPCARLSWRSGVFVSVACSGGQSGCCAEGVERSFAWPSCYRRLNTIVERSKDHLIAFVAIAFISILALRLKRLVAEDLSA